MRLFGRHKHERKIKAYNSKPSEQSNRKKVGKHLSNPLKKAKVNHEISVYLPSAWNSNSQKIFA